MQLDWFTIVAEIINFLILVALLKYFLYDRILGIADKREAKIAARFAEAEQKRAEADEKAESFQARQQELDEQRQQLMAQAKEEAEKRRRELIERAKQEVDTQKQQWQQSIQRQQDSFLQELRREAGQQTITLARRALADLANAGLEAQMIERFLEKLKDMPAEEQEKMADSLRESKQKPVITTAFNLSSQNRAHLSTALQEQFGDNLEGRFNTAPDLICGIELKTNGHKIAWSLNNYLDNLAENLAQTFQDEPQEDKLPRQDKPQEDEPQEETEADEG